MQAVWTLCTRTSSSARCPWQRWWAGVSLPRRSHRSSRPARGVPWAVKLVLIGHSCRHHYSSPKLFESSLSSLWTNWLLTLKSCEDCKRTPFDRDTRSCPNRFLSCAKPISLRRTGWFPGSLRCCVCVGHRDRKGSVSGPVSCTASQVLSEEHRHQSAQGAVRHRCSLPGPCR